MLQLKISIFKNQIKDIFKVGAGLMDDWVPKTRGLLLAHRLL